MRKYEHSSVGNMWCLHTFSMYLQAYGGLGVGSQFNEKEALGSGRYSGNVF